MNLNIRIKNRMCCYFDEIIKLDYFDVDNTFDR